MVAIVECQHNQYIYFHNFYNTDLLPHCYTLADVVVSVLSSTIVNSKLFLLSLPDLVIVMVVLQQKLQELSKRGGFCSA